MRLEHLQVSNCRNLRNVSLKADTELTVIAGKNGQGKTNLLECIWLLTGAKSFRGVRDMDIVQRGQPSGRIEGQTLTQAGNKNIDLFIGGEEAQKRGRWAKVNGVSYGRATAIAGVFTAVVFDPGHLSLVKGGPDGRRRFIDAALCQLYPGYVETLRQMHRALTQKNALLKRWQDTPDADGMLDSFDEAIGISGAEIIRRRGEYLARLAPMARRIYSEISGGAEELEIHYMPCCEPQQLLQLLRDGRRADVRAGFCTKGPHREDFEALVNSTSARIYGSQGQQRSVALALKLAEAEAARDITGEHPVMLLDDVLSELDEGRQAYLLGRMSGKQSFVTTCDAGAFARTAGSVVLVSGGEIVDSL